MTLTRVSFSHILLSFFTPLVPQGECQLGICLDMVCMWWLAYYCCGHELIHTSMLFSHSYPLINYLRCDIVSVWSVWGYHQLSKDLPMFVLTEAISWLQWGTAVFILFRLSTITPSPWAWGLLELVSLRICWYPSEALGLEPTPWRNYMMSTRETKFGISFTLQILITIDCRFTNLEWETF